MWENTIATAVGQVHNKCKVVDSFTIEKIRNANRIVRKTEVKEPEIKKEDTEEKSEEPKEDPAPKSPAPVRKTTKKRSRKKVKKS